MIQNPIKGIYYTSDKKKRSRMSSRPTTSVKDEIRRLIARFGAELSADALREAYFEARGLPVPPVPAPPVLLRALVELLPRSEPEIARQLKIAQEALAKNNYSAAQPALERAAQWYLSHGQPPSAGRPAVPADRSSPSGISEHGSLLHEDTTPFNELFIVFIDQIILPFLSPEADLHALAETLLERLRREPLGGELAYELKLLLEAAAPIVLALNDHARDLTRLVELMLRHLDQFVLEAEIARQQVKFIREALSRMHEAGLLEEASERLERLIEAQQKIIQERRLAEDEIKRLLAVVVERLLTYSTASEHYAEDLGAVAHQIQRARSLAELRDLLAQTITKTLKMQENTRQTAATAQHLQRELAATRDRMAQLEQELKALAEQTLKDPLTGLMNRRGLEQFWQRESIRAARAKTPLSVGVLDLDNFKKFNDTYGHLAGDEALRHLAGIAKRYLRPQDGIGRWGGEEFVIILPDADLKAAERALQRLQRELTRALFFYDNQHILITFSAGVAEWRGAAETFEQLLQRADAALYEAKRSGKNRVVTAA